MDLCCLVPENDGRTPSELVVVLADVIRAETDFTVLALPKARIPILKISRGPTDDVPFDIACDIGFNNQLALENTRLLLSYAMLDPPRLRSLVLFLKVWTKRRKLNSPYMGTLSSYGYTLMVLFFLIHVKRPPVLPNLQRLSAGRPLTPDEVLLEGHNIYFYDDIDMLRRVWKTDNTDNVGELLLDFFRYFARDFNYAREAISLQTNSGIITKEARGWGTEHLCIEDPFQLGYNVARNVTRDGLYTIRGEFMRASRLLANRGMRASTLLAELCEEREDGLVRAPDYPRRDGARARSLGRTYDRPSHHASLDEAMARSFGAPYLMPSPAVMTPMTMPDHMLRASLDEHMPPLPAPAYVRPLAGAPQLSPMPAPPPPEQGGPSMAMSHAASDGSPASAADDEGEGVFGMSPVS